MASVSVLIVRSDTVMARDVLSNVLLQFRLCDYEKHESSCTSGSQREGGARRMPVNWEK